MGRVADVQLRPIHNRSNYKPNHKNKDRRGKSDIGNEAFVVWLIRDAVAKCFADQKENEERQTKKDCSGAAPSTPDCGAALITVIVHANRLAIKRMSAMAHILV